jgi:hypothetical protein
LLINPTEPNLSEPIVVKEVEAAARPLGKQIQLAETLGKRLEVDLRQVKRRRSLLADEDPMLAV